MTTPTITLTALDDDELAKGKVTVEVKMEQPPEGYTYSSQWDTDTEAYFSNIDCEGGGIAWPYPKGAEVDTRHCLSRGYGGKNIYHNITATVTDVAAEMRNGEWVEIVTLTKEE